MPPALRQRSCSSATPFRQFRLECSAKTITLEGFPPLPRADRHRAGRHRASAPSLPRAGLWNARRLVARQRHARRGLGRHGASAVPLVILFSVWLAFGNLDRDLVHAAVAMVLAGGFVLARRNDRARRSAAAAGRSGRLLCAGRRRRWPVAGAAHGLQPWLDDGPARRRIGAAGLCDALSRLSRARLAECGRRGIPCCSASPSTRPSSVSQPCRQTPVFNWLLPGYGVPALGAAFAGWQLARTTDGRPRLVMEAAASFFALIGAAMLVRHAMHGGVIDAGYADACRAGDLHADRAGRQRHPDRAGRALAEPGLPHRLDRSSACCRRRWW